MKWQPLFGQAGDWHWKCAVLPNGWTPSVHDNSQACVPAQPTLYDVAASCKHWLAKGPRVRTLEEAKRLAIDLAFEQMQCCEQYDGSGHAPGAKQVKAR